MLFVTDKYIIIQCLTPYKNTLSDGFFFKKNIVLETIPFVGVVICIHKIVQVANISQNKEILNNSVLFSRLDILILVGLLLRG